MKEKQLLSRKTTENIIIIASIVMIIAVALLYIPKFSVPNGHQKAAELSQALKKETQDSQKIESASQASAEPPMYLKKYSRLNPDTVGYFSIEGTAVDYPVVQANDNEYYIAHGFNKNEGSAGAVFMDYDVILMIFLKHET